MIDVETLVSGQNYFRNKRGNLIDNHTVFLISNAFFSIKALHSLMYDYSLPSLSGISSSNKPITDSNGIHLGMFPNPQKFSQFRAAISLTGDVYNCLDAVLQKELFDLKPKIQKLFDEANKFRTVRNFFTHLDNVLKNPEGHGVDGPLKTEFGIEYAESAKNRFHLIIHNETIYFTQYKKSEKMYIGRSAFLPIFDAARDVFRELLSETAHEKLSQYPDPDLLFQIKVK